MSEVTQDDKTMAMIAHITAIVSIGPLIIWLMNKDNPEKSFVTTNAKEALNFVITIWFVMIGLSVLMTIFGFIPVLGWLVAICLWLVMMAAGVTALVFVIMAGMKANEGVDYRYPFAIRLIK